MIMQNRNRVPDAYFRKSRDFQMLCNLYDCIDLGVKFDIDSILNSTNTKNCNENTLSLLQHKLGFFTNLNINNESLRIILSGFPYILKNKGSRKGISDCIQLFMNSINVDTNYRIEVINNKIENVYNKNENKNELLFSNLKATYIVKIGIKNENLDIKLLDEMLKYVIPAGYGIEYYIYNEFVLDTSIFSKDTINIVFVRSVDEENNYALASKVSSIDNQMPDLNQGILYKYHESNNKTEGES